MIKYVFHDDSFDDGVMERIAEIYGIEDPDLSFCAECGPTYMEPGITISNLPGLEGRNDIELTDDPVGSYDVKTNTQILIIETFNELSGDDVLNLVKNHGWVIEKCYIE